MAVVNWSSEEIVLRGDDFEVRDDLDLWQMLQGAFRSWPNSVALIDAMSKQSWTYKQLSDAALTLAQGLLLMGLGHGDIIAVCSENRQEVLLVALAAVRIGATCSFINCFFSDGELRHVFSISRPHIVFCSPSTISKLVVVSCASQEHTIKVILFGDAAWVSLTTAPQEQSLCETVMACVEKPKEAVAFLFCSSGTTGLVKCVEQTHHNAVANIMLSGTGPSAGAIFCLVPLYHAYGLGLVMRALAQEAPLILGFKFEEKNIFEVVEKYKVATLPLVPMHLQRLVNSPLLEKYNLSNLLEVIVAGSPLRRNVHEAAQKRLQGINIRQCYGMTELTSNVLVVPQGRLALGSCGKLVPGMMCKVVDLETGKALPENKEGELCFRGPLVMKGYRSAPEATEELIDLHGWLRTGDLGYYDSEGWFYITDRIKEMIKYRASQVPPAELEALLLTHPSVEDVAVIGKPDEVFGELPLALVVKRVDSFVTEADIIKFVADRISDQKHLRGGVRFINQIPKTPNGKILRRALRIFVANGEEQHHPDYEVVLQ